MIVQCKVCGKDTDKKLFYIKKFKGNVYCSMDCYHKKLKERFPEVRSICIRCNKEFKIYPSDVKLNRGKLCSKECKDKYQVGENASHYVPKAKRVCKQCGNSFEIYQWRLKSIERGQFCTRECRYRYMVGNKSHRYTEGKYATEDLTARSRRAIQHWKKAVLKRDKHTCIGCGTIENLEIHHIKPYSTHIELRTDIDNGQTLCEDCHKETPTYGRNNLKREDFE